MLHKRAKNIILSPLTYSTNFNSVKAILTYASSQSDSTQIDSSIILFQLKKDALTILLIHVGGISKQVDKLTG